MKFLLLITVFIVAEAGPVAQFVGTQHDFSYITTDGTLGPWKVAVSVGEPFFKIFTYDIQVTRTGVYLIFAQVTFVTSLPSVSFDIYSSNNYTSPIAHCVENTLQKCNEEASCFTQIIQEIDRDSKLFVNVNGTRLYVNMMPAKTYIGLKPIYFLPEE